MAQGKPSKSKLRRIGADKAYYTRYREHYRGKLLRRRADRARRIKAAIDFPKLGSPSQLRARKARSIQTVLTKSDNASFNPEPEGD